MAKNKTEIHVTTVFDGELDATDVFVTSLLPAFRGAHAIEQALEYGVKVFGVTIHYVDAELDGGRIIAQRAFPYEGDDIGELEAMIHAVEYPLYIETIKKLIE